VKRYVTDTHAVLWYLSGDKRLSRRARTAFLRAKDGYGQIIVPSIVLVEAVFILQRQRVSSDVIERLLNLPDSPDAGITVFPLTAPIARECASFGPVAVPEMPDRIIAATARYLGLSLLTVDPVIAESELVTVVW
jgi:PIN domain nuclease of toxin-antitoxin system